jgi:hypothetical protein
MASITNVSLSGAFLETKLQLPVNTKITLEPLTSAGAALEGLKLAARVARIDPHGLGIEWQVLATPQTLALLGAVIQPAPIPWPVQAGE